MVGESLLIKLAEKVVDKIFEKTAGKPISKFLEDIEKKNAFKKAIAESFQALVEKGFKLGRAGTLYKEFFLDEDVIDELWLKVVDPACDEEIDFDVLENKFKECWKAHVDIDKKARDGIMYFCDRLDTAVYRRTELYDLLNTKRLREARDWISLGEIERLKKKCLEHIRKTKEDEFQELLGEGNDYVEPALERKTERPLREMMPPRLEAKKKKVEEETYFAPISIAEIVRADRNDYVLVSESGMGKTTFLKWLELSISEGELSKDYVPVYIHLSTLKDYTTHDQLISRLATQFAKVAAERKLKKFVGTILKESKFLFLLDGLDQVPDLSILSHQLENKGIYSGNKMIVATRQMGYDLTEVRLKNYEFIQLAPFDQKRIESYLKDDSDNPAVKEIIRQNRELVRIPILLQMICSLLREADASRSEIKTRSHVYDRFVNHLLEHERHVRVTRLSAEKRRLDLQKLSYDLIDRDLLGSFPEREGYRILEETELGILLDWGILNRLIERTKDEIGFRHQSFQEYFASLELGNRILAEDGGIKEQPFRQHIEYRKWDQSFLFLVGLSDKNTGKKLIEKTKDYDIFLAGLCVSHYAGDKLEFRDIIDELFVLSRMGFRTRSLEILSKIQIDYVVDRLVELVAKGEFESADYAAHALGEMRHPKAVEPLIGLLKHEEQPVRWCAAETLGRIGDSRAIDPLMDVLDDENEDEDVSEIAGEALDNMEAPERVDALAKALHHENRRIRLNAAFYLGRIGGSRAANPLAEALQDEDTDVRQRAAIGLGKIRNPKAVDALLRALHHEDEQLRCVAATALGKIGSPKGVDGLIIASEDKDQFVRQAATEALARIGDPRAIDALTGALRDENGYVREHAAEGLGDIGDPKAVDALLKVLSEGAAWVSPIIEALGKIGDPKAVPGLTKFLNEGRGFDRGGAAMALGRIGDAKAVDTLISILRGEDEDIVREAAAEALGEIGDPRALDPLISALQCKNEDYLRRSATRALGEIGDPRAVDPLIGALNDEEVGLTAAEALGGIIGYEKLILVLKNRGQKFLLGNKYLIGQLLEKSPRRFLELGWRYWEW